MIDDSKTIKKLNNWIPVTTTSLLIIIMISIYRLPVFRICYTITCFVL